MNSRIKYLIISLSFALLIYFFRYPILYTKIAEVNSPCDEYVAKMYHKEPIVAMPGQGGTGKIVFIVVENKFGIPVSSSEDFYSPDLDWEWDCTSKVINLGKCRIVKY